MFVYCFNSYLILCLFKVHENGGTANGNHEGNGQKEDTAKRKVIFTGFTASTLSEMERMTRDLGAEVLSSSELAGATHLVMPRLGRTIKFLCALAHVRHVVSPTWVKDSHQDKRFKGKSTCIGSMCDAH